MEAIETIEQDGWTAKLYADPDPQSPDDWDNLGTLEHSSGFRFGSPTGEPSRGWGVHARYLRIFEPLCAMAIAVRIEDYGSNGARIHECEYDQSYANGVIYTTHQRLNELCGESAEYHSPEWAREALMGELAVWDQYAEGEVYGYVVEDQAGDHHDSLWGLYGSKYALGEATEALSACIKDESETVAAIERITAL